MSISIIQPPPEILFQLHLQNLVLKVSVVFTTRYLPVHPIISFSFKLTAISCCSAYCSHETVLLVVFALPLLTANGMALRSRGLTAEAKPYAETRVTHRFRLGWARNWIAELVTRLKRLYVTYVPHPKVIAVGRYSYSLQGLANPLDGYTEDYFVPQPLFELCSVVFTRLRPRLLKQAVRQFFAYISSKPATSSGRMELGFL